MVAIGRPRNRKTNHLNSLWSTHKTEGPGIGQGLFWKRLGCVVASGFPHLDAGQECPCEADGKSVEGEGCQLICRQDERKAPSVTIGPTPGGSIGAIIAHASPSQPAPENHPRSSMKSMRAALLRSMIGLLDTVIHCRSTREFQGAAQHRPFARCSWQAERLLPDRG
jgi:hypothetical protein